MTLLASNSARVRSVVNLDALRDRPILLTGATGLIGVNLQQTLTDAGAIVATPRGHATPVTGLFDYIIHAAGYAQPAKFLSDPMGTAAVNTTMLMALLDRLAPGGRLLFLSTSEIYSGNPRGLHNENDIGTTTPLHPRGIYIESKRAGEAICYAARQAGKHAIIARVSSVYGPGVRKGDTRVMSELIHQALMYDEITLKDGGTARRVFLYVSDAVEMLLNILLHGEQIVYNCGGHAFNTGRNGVTWGNMIGEMSIITLARKIGEHLKVPVRTPSQGMGASEGAPVHVGLDMSRYLREFGEKQYVGPDEGLPLTIQWHQELLGEKPRVGKRVSA